MTDQQTIPVAHFTNGLAETLRELFEHVPSPSMMLDQGDSFFETLPTISAAEASIPAANGISNIAAQVNHVTYYIDITRQFVSGTPPEKVDWPGSWQVGEVSEEQWTALQAGLRRAYDDLIGMATAPGGWSDPGAVGGGIATAAHCAYHLGEVRRTLGVIRGR